jgi:hypothetical protein
MRKIIVLIASVAACVVPAVASAAPASIVGGTEALHPIGLSTVWGLSAVRPAAKHSAPRLRSPIGLTVVWGY